MLGPDYFRVLVSRKSVGDALGKFSITIGGIPASPSSLPVLRWRNGPWVRVD